jgi:threonine dehydratase
VALPEDVIAANTSLLAATTGVPADCAGGAALGALVHALDDCTIDHGSRVVLVISGERPEPVQAHLARVTTVEPDASHVLAALGVHS